MVDPTSSEIRDAARELVALHADDHTAAADTDQLTSLHGFRGLVQAALVGTGLDVANPNVMHHTLVAVDKYAVTDSNSPVEFRHNKKKTTRAHVVTAIGQLVRLYGQYPRSIVARQKCAEETLQGYGRTLSDSNRAATVQEFRVVYIEYVIDVLSNPAKRKRAFELVDDETASAAPSDFLHWSLNRSSSVQPPSRGRMRLLM